MWYMYVYDDCEVIVCVGWQGNTESHIVGVAGAIQYNRPDHGLAVEGPDRSGILDA